MRTRTCWFLFWETVKIGQETCYDSVLLLLKTTFKGIGSVEFQIRLAKKFAWYCSMCNVIPSL